MKMRPVLAIIALVNGMIGSLILILPVLTMVSGTFISFVIILVSGFFSFYSCYLYIKHLGNHSDVDKSVYYHFGSSKIAQIFYNFVIFSNLLLILISYFQLIVQQWDDLTSNAIWNPIGNAFALFFLILFLKYIRFGAHLLGYGVISITLYCAFLMWLLVSRPNDDKKIPAIGINIGSLASAIGQGFSIQQFFIPVLKQLPVYEKKNFAKYTLIVYIIGGLIYFYIAFAGAFGIINRTSYNCNITTILDYFKKGEWQISVIEAVYLLHLYSAFGQFLLISKKRLFCIFNTLFKVRNTKSSEFFSYQQIIFVVITIGLCLGVELGQVSIDKVIQFNGAIIGFFFIYLIPAMMQFKCLYFARPKAIIQVIFGRSTTTNGRTNKSRNFQLKQRTQSIGMSTIINQKYKVKQSEEFKDRQSKSKIDKDLGNQIKQQKYKNQTNQKQSPVELKQEEQVKKSRISGFQLQANQLGNIEKRQELLMAGADVSIAISNLGQEQPSMQIHKINEVCTCRKPEGIYKFLDLLSIFGMVAFGVFIMIYGIINFGNIRATTKL